MPRVGKFAIHLKPDGTFDLFRLTAKMDAHSAAETFSPRRTDPAALNVQVRDGGVLIVVDSGRLIPVVEALTGSRCTTLPPVFDQASMKALNADRFLKSEKPPRKKGRIK